MRWVSKRTPWGDPDLQGTYTNKTIKKYHPSPARLLKPFDASNGVDVRRVQKIRIICKLQPLRKMLLLYFVSQGIEFAATESFDETGPCLSFCPVSRR